MPKKQPTNEQDFLLGGILAFLGLYVILSPSHDLLSGFSLLGLGIVFMASSNKEFRKQFFDFIFSIFKGL